MLSSSCSRAGWVAWARGPRHASGLAEELRRARRDHGPLDPDIELLRVLAGEDALAFSLGQGDPPRAKNGEQRLRFPLGFASRLVTPREVALVFDLSDAHSGLQRDAVTFAEGVEDPVPV